MFVLPCSKVVAVLFYSVLLYYNTAKVWHFFYSTKYFSKKMQKNCEKNTHYLIIYGRL